MSKANSILLWQDLHDIADKVCEHFGLSYGKILPTVRQKGKHYGEVWPCEKCIKSEYIDELNCTEKILYIRIHQISKPRIALSSSTILGTLAHELAHLGEWKHGPNHETLELEIIAFMSELGYSI
jgi:hypothetical protein